MHFPHLPAKWRAKLLLLIFMLALGLSLASNRSVQAQLIVGPLPMPTVTVADVPATTIATKDWLGDAWVYIRNKMASVFFQNTARKVLNDFAKDAATYLGAGGKGQTALFIKQKYENFWANVGDKALGDYIESFANSVVSDIAYNDIVNKKQAACANALAACTGTYIEGSPEYDKCVADNQLCVYKIDDKTGGLNKCSKALTTCIDGCVGTYLADAQPDCIRSCNAINQTCTDATVGALDKLRKKPMLGLSSPLDKLNICNPNFNIALKINLGLVNTQTAWRPDCSFTTMVRNWNTQYDRIRDMSSKSFLKTFSNYFNPVSSDLSVAWILNSNIIEYQGKKISDSEKETIANQGWLDVRNFAGDLVGTKGDAQTRRQLTDQALWDNMGKVTGDILVDAANIFLNQILITGWQNLMGNLSDTTSQTNLNSFYNTSSPGRAAIEAKISKLTEPVFSEPGRMDILSQLAACPDESKPGPTNCVISSGFSSALTNKMTLVDAVKQGTLPGDWPFGFNKFGEDKLVYNQGYPYRSILILRKYRIVPVGWELAAQEIQRQYSQALGAVQGAAPSGLSADRPDGISLNDLLACYNPNDDITGYSAAWCQGLVDPYWVLKLPDYYCKAKGYGPEIQGEIGQVPSGIKYCSTDQGKTMSKVDDEQKECGSDNDCCTESELVYKDQLSQRNDAKTLRSFKCVSACTYTASRLTLQRADSYCADEQQCIKTDAKGNCLYYGYCTAERRKWVFSRNNQDQACDAYANTCTAYRDDKNTAHYYLANTLDFAQCDASNIGCRKYALGGDWNPANSTIAWSATPAIHLNARSANCAAGDESCHQFTRLNQEKGSNLIGDGDFELHDAAHWQSSGSVPSDQSFAGTYSLHVAPGQRGVYFGSDDTTLLPEGFAFDSNQTYTLSAMVYTVSGQVEMGIGKKGDKASYEVAASDQLGKWENFVVSIDNTFDVNADSLYIKGLTPATDFFVDNLQLTIGTDSDFTPYGSANAAYLKLLPTYMEKVCYVNPPSDYSLRQDAPAECNKFVRRCSKEEEGCELFTDAISKDQIAAKVKIKDKCPGECVGFDTFVQKANNFYAAREDHFIPATARACGANAVGCAAFTNLDKLKQGGENIEYYAQMRSCIKPSDQCGIFQVWEGSADSGYQIRSYSLRQNAQTLDSLSQPFTVSDNDQSDNIDGSSCNELIYSLPPDDPSYNPNCSQFIGKDGKLSYHNFSKTVACSDSCTPFRLAKNNIDNSLDTAGACAAASGHWDAANSNCVVCYGGGAWDNEQNGCVYMGLSSESVGCSAEQAGCSEYVGNFSNRVRIIINDTFEGGLNNWLPLGVGGASISSEALTQGGHSVHTSASYLEKSIPNVIKVGKKYELTFIAKTKAPADFIDNIHFVKKDNNFGDSLTFVSQLKLTADWRQYKFAINSVNDTDINRLVIALNTTAQNGTNIYLDNIKLTEVDDHYYLVKDSWNTPVSCNQDFRGNPFPLFMLGCRAYTNRAGDKVDLKSFSGLCQLSGVGCEAMIDTNNSSDYRKQVFNDGVDLVYSVVNGQTVTAPTAKNGKCDSNEPSCLEVPADKMAYVVYDSGKTCFQQKKGCQRMGMAASDNVSYEDVYKINDPDLYISQLCKNQDVGCAAWQMGQGGEVYFKDPGDQLCEYRQQANSQTYTWLKKKLSYCYSATKCTDNGQCSGTASVCRKADDGLSYCASSDVCGNTCGTGLTCKLENKEIACNLDYLKTIGLGVAAEKAQPVGMAEKVMPGGFTTHDFAGACTQAQAGCTEYIDPESRINFNILIKTDLSAAATAPVQISIKPDVLYIVKAANKQTASVSCTSVNTGDTPSQKIDSVTGLALLDNDNYLKLVPADANGAASFTVAQNIGNDNGLSEEFIIDTHSPAGTVSDIKSVNCAVTGGAEVKEAIVSYRLKQSIDRDTPTAVDFVKGAILFNERSYSGGKSLGLSWQTAMTSKEGQPDGIKGQPVPPGNNANKLMQVDADRECAEWLGCKSYGISPLNSKEKMCFERGLCNQLNDAGECVNFINADTARQTYDSTNPSSMSQWMEKMSNMTGYVKVGVKGNQYSADLYPLAVMTEQGDLKVPFDGTFETAFDTGFQSIATLGVKNPTYAPVIRDAGVLQTELGISSYQVTPDGQTIGKGSGSIVKDITNAGGSDYILSAYVFMRTGTKVELTVGRADGGSACVIQDENGKSICEPNTSYATVASTGISGSWQRLVGRFKISDDYASSAYGNSKVRINKLRIGLKTLGFVYFDQILMEPGLQAADKQYIAPSCRLYPQRDSLSCDYFDTGGVRRKGWNGYCLETDPRNSSVCLMWYPLDKVASEDFEEGASLNIPEDLYYCVYAEDQCRADYKVEPEMACKTFLKVDKTKYWYQRINTGSSYVLKNTLLRPGTTGTNSALVINMGVDTTEKAGGSSTLAISQNIGSGFYGAYITKKPLSSSVGMGLVGPATDKRPSPFVPYSGYSLGAQPAGTPGRVDRICRATVDKDFNDSPIEVQEGNGSGNSTEQKLGTFDDCYVGIATQWADCNPDKEGIGLCCGSSYKYANRNSGSACPDNATNHWTNLGLNSWATRYYVGDYWDCGWAIPGYLSVGCEVRPKPNGLFLGWTRDNCSDTDEVSCFFDCYYHVKGFNMGLTQNNAVSAVNRLFVGVDSSDNLASNGCYTWSPTTQSYKPCDNAYPSDFKNYFKDYSAPSGETNQLKACNGDGSARKDPDDVCYVLPKVSNLAFNTSAVHSKGWVQFAFNSDVDPEQLPLRQYIVDWGYGSPALNRSANMFSRPAGSSAPHVVIHFYTYADIKMNPNGCGGDPLGKELTPHVTIVDNWARYNNIGAASPKLCVLPN